MIVRALDGNGDWTFGKGRNDYKKNLHAITQNIQTRLSSFLGDCFFDLSAGIDWWDLLGSKNQIGLSLAVSTTILNTYGVTGILQLQVDLNHVTRVFSVKYRVQTIFSVTGGQFQYDLNGIA